MEMEYTFQITPYPVQELVHQVSQALEKRTELRSRQEYPGMWQKTDRLRQRKKAAGDVLRRRRLRYRLFGAVFLVLGLFLLIPGLTAPQELAIPLMTGILSVGLGLFYIWGSLGQGRRQFDRAAQKLLSSLDTSASIQVRFDGDGMRMDKLEPVPYQLFDCVVETPDLFLLTWSGRVAVLQKKDLTQHLPVVAEGLLHRGKQRRCCFLPWSRRRKNTGREYQAWYSRPFAIWSGNAGCSFYRAPDKPAGASPAPGMCGADGVSALTRPIPGAPEALPPSATGGRFCRGNHLCSGTGPGGAGRG